MSKFVIIWYPTSGDGRVRPQFMCGEPDDERGDHDEDATLFPNEDEAERTATMSMAYPAWPHIVVELP